MSDRPPSVDSLVRGLASDLPRKLVVQIARRAIDDSRLSETSIPQELAQTYLLELLHERPQSVVNATGVLAHTNLGRSVLAPSASQAAHNSATRYSNLEFDLDRGERGRRGAYTERLLRELTGAESAVVVNNNAGALFLTIAALGGEGEVPVSRGELIEIGGSYRLPDLMAAGKAQMVEVGTTNRTRISDYADAITDATTMILKVHPSNYQIVGFAEAPTTQDLAELAHSRDLPLVFDVGSGLLNADVPWLSGPPPKWLAGEPAVSQSLEAGADLVMFSGDKLLGGPQAGIIVGKAELIERIRKHPIARAMRIDGPSLAALAGTLDLYASDRGRDVPLWQMVAAPYRELERRLSSVATEAGIEPTIEKGTSVPGAGSVPGATFESPVLVVNCQDTDRIWRGLMDHTPPVVARRDSGKLIIDLRAVAPSDDAHVASALRNACR